MNDMIRVYLLIFIGFIILGCVPDYWNNGDDSHKAYLVRCSDGKYYAYTSDRPLDQDFICSYLGIEDTYELIKENQSRSDR